MHVTKKLTTKTSIKSTPIIKSQVVIEKMNIDLPTKIKLEKQKNLPKGVRR